MIKNIKRKLSLKKHRKLISNFSYMSIINIANRALPLLVIPYIVNTIGVEKFGVISFALMIIMYFKLITEYSFGLTATKYISQHRDNRDKVSEHFWLVITTRVIFASILFILFVPLIFSVELFYEQKEVFFFTFLLVFADVLMPLWFFRGIEEMKYIAIFNIIAKLLYTATIFLFINFEADYILIPLCNSLTLIVVSIIALYFSITRFNIQFILPSRKNILKEINEGKDIFYSNMSVSFYTTINNVLLGFFTNYTAVGVYALAEALFNAFNGIIKTYTMVIYPHLAKYSTKSTELLTQARKFFRLYLMVLVAASVFLFLTSEFIIELLYGEGHENSITILKILALALLLEPLGGFFTAYLSLKSKYKTIRSITFKTMLINLILVIPMILLYEEKGVAYLFLLLSIVQVYLNLKHSSELILSKERL